MNDLDRNTRTLIVSFVIAIFCLIPLRFYEAGSQYAASRAEVLGAHQEVVLPDSELRSDSKQPVLEFPYGEIENSDCMSQAEADKLVSGLTELLKTPGLGDEIVNEAMEEIASAQANVCK